MGDTGLEPSTLFRLKTAKTQDDGAPYDARSVPALDIDSDVDLRRLLTAWSELTMGDRRAIADQAESYLRED